MAIRWDKFTVKSQEAVQRANELASEHGNPELAPVHLLAALVEDLPSTGAAARRTLMRSPCRPANCVFRAPGCTCSSRTILLIPASPPRRARTAAVAGHVVAGQPASGEVFQGS